MIQPAMSMRARPAVGRLRGRFAAGIAVALAVLFASPGYAMDDSPPPLSPGGPGESAAAPPQSEAPAPVEPAAARPAPAARPKPQRDVQIEQKHVGRRLSEVIVTPAGFTYQYTMINLEGQDSGSVLQPHPGLSVPRFFRFDF
jgi:hypothetical protein